MVINYCDGLSAEDVKNAGDLDLSSLPQDAVVCIRRVRSCPTSTTKLTDHPRVVFLEPTDDAGFSLALVALTAKEDYCWRCCYIANRSRVMMGICPVCGGDFDD